MIDFKISVDLSELLQTAPVINRKVFPLLHQAVGTVAQATADLWKEQVYRARLWDGEKQPYIESIRWQYTGDFSAEVISDYKHAAAIEEGRPPRDLKKMLDTSPKVRRTQDGRRFLVIPFRHNVPGSSALAASMPAAVYQASRLLEASRIVGQGQRPSGEVTVLSPRGGMRPAAQQTPYLSNPSTRSDYQVARNEYQWGGRLRTKGMSGLSREQQRRYEGMYRFDVSTPGAKRSVYLTFRTMMEGSSGWVVPAKPGLQLARKVVDAIQPKAEEAFSEALRRELNG